MCGRSFPSRAQCLGPSYEKLCAAFSPGGSVKPQAKEYFYSMGWAFRNEESASEKGRLLFGEDFQEGSRKGLPAPINQWVVETCVATWEPGLGCWRRGRLQTVAGR